MSNSVFIHLNYEINAKINVNKVNDADRLDIGLGSETNIFTTVKQAELLFYNLDKALHKKTYSQLEEVCLGLEVDLEEKQSTIDYYRELKEEEGYRR